ncbi:glycosyltransferase family 1 protein [Halomonas sp. PAMB 3232]|uniref:glycosyltransferase family 4 protein n=1 Tax=Halomonas sp. PAMB 3232 TaxID=3075221 RepID=UPI00289A7D38|nr:glycosyltransferase family 1 protein [Halomonas sp. PAMB 3232]WNL38727.1 glycosyltransferase family 1 protein [Halomonas sp. PAMB 3232]
MRLCIVSETWAPDINGVAHTLNRLACELDRLDVQVDVVRPAPRAQKPRSTAGEELQVYRLPLPGYAEVQVGLATPGMLTRFWKKHPPDAVYLATQGPLGLAARRVARKLGIVCVAGWHTNFDHYCHDYGIGWLSAATLRYLRHFHNGCALTLVPTHAQARTLHKAGIRDVSVLSRGIDGEHFSPAHRDDTLRDQWGVNEHQSVALYAGRLAAEKNLTLLVETFQAMREVRPDMAQVIVGDGPARAQLQKALPQAHFTGFLDQPSLARHYASADIFVFPSLSETWGNVITEAMASGLAVVAFDHAASAELIRHGHNGLSIAPDDPRGFHQAAAELCQHPADYARLGRTARLSVLEHSWSGIAEQFKRYLHTAQEAHHALSPACRIRSS